MTLSSLLVFIFFIFYFLFLIIDFSTRFHLCKQNQKDTVTLLKVSFLIILHRFIYVFLFFGWLFPSKIILITYVFFLISIVIYWKVEDDTCDLTKIENEMCQYENYEYFDYLFQIFQKETAMIIEYVLLGSFLLIALWKLFGNSILKKSSIQS